MQWLSTAKSYKWILYIPELSGHTLKECIARQHVEFLWLHKAWNKEEYGGKAVQHG